jgi:hypothetical protein
MRSVALGGPLRQGEPLVERGGIGLAEQVFETLKQRAPRE